MSLMPDPTFYPSPKMAMQAPLERLAYVALLNDGKNGKHDTMGVIDLDPDSSEYGRVVGQVDFGRGDNELHHFGWNACSACLIWFTVWSSVVHAVVMAAQALVNPEHIAHLRGDVPALFLVAAVLAFLTPRGV